MTSRPRRALSAAALAGIALAAAALAEGQRLRHLAVPALRDASLPRAAAAEPAPLPECAVERVLATSRRVTALLVDSGGALWAGHFDAGVTVRDREGRVAAVPGLSGRARFVNALAEHGGAVWAATQGGLLALRDGRLAARALAGEGVTALAAADGVLYAGTARGLFRIGPDGAPEALEIGGHDGEALRTTALAASGDTLWIGTASGAWSVALGAPRGARARWHPLVFGDPGAETNVVTALAPFEGGAIAGTDDGGLVRLHADGRVSAVRLADPRANEVNPGAAAARAGAILAGTQGGGLLVARARGGSLAVARSPTLERASVSAVWAEPGGGVLVGTDDGAVLRVVCGALR